MNKTFKLILLITIILAALLFAGCSKITITGEISPDFIITYQGDVELDMSKYSHSQQSLAQDSLMKLSDYWQSIGYASEATFEDDTYHVFFKTQKLCESYEEAYAELFKLMTDDYSPFSTLSYEYIPYDNYSEYKVNGSMDISDAIDLEVYSSMNEDVQTQMASHISSLDANIVFILPDQENISQSPYLTKTFTTEVLIDNITEFSFDGKIYNPTISKENKDVIEKYNSYTKLNFVLIGILAALILLIVLVIVKIKKK